VALELRQTTNAVLGATYETKANASAQWNLEIAESPVRAPMLMRCMEGGKDELSVEDKIRFESMLIAGYQIQDARHYQYELGLFDDEYYERTLQPELAMWVPRWRDWGLLDPDSDSYLMRTMRPSFLEEIEKHIDRPESDSQRYYPQGPE
jgi:hypothetical protein